MHLYVSHVNSSAIFYFLLFLQFIALNAGKCRQFYVLGVYIYTQVALAWLIGVSRKNRAHLQNDADKFVAILFGRETVEQKPKRIIRIQQHIHIRLRETTIACFVALFESHQEPDPENDHGQ